MVDLLQCLAAMTEGVMAVDGNGQSDALTDGLLILRYMFGLRGPSLVAGAVATGAPRTTAADIESQLSSLSPQSRRCWRIVCTSSRMNDALSIPCSGCATSRALREKRHDRRQRTAAESQQADRRLRLGQPDRQLAQAATRIVTRSSCAKRSASFS